MDIDIFVRYLDFIINCNFVDVETEKEKNVRELFFILCDGKSPFSDQYFYDKHKKEL